MLRSSAQAPPSGTTAPVIPFAEQAPVYVPFVGGEPGGGVPTEAKPFPWMWVGIGAAVLVWYFFLRKK